MSKIVLACLLQRRLLTSIIPVILVSSLLYWQNLQWLYSQWTSDKVYSHGFFVPLICLYLIWGKKEFFRSVPRKPSKIFGYFSVCCCLLLLLVGRAGAIIQIEALSFFLIIPSALLLLYGWQYLKALLFPIFYLQFMIPWIDPILKRLHSPFQHITATIGTTLLGLKYPVYTDELSIHLPNISMVVAQECSGINFLISVIAIGLPLVYLSQKTWARAAMVVIIGCILTVLSNGLRVAIAGYCGQNYGPELLHGPAHIFQGWFVAWFGWIGLFFVNWLFEKIPYKNGEPTYHLYERWRGENKTVYSSPTNSPSLSFHFSTLLCLLLFFSLYLNFLAMPKAMDLKAPLQQLPANIAGWQGSPSDWLDENKYFPNLDEEYSRVYRNQSGNMVYLFIGYYRKQDNEKRLVSYLSERLHNNSKTVTISQGRSSFDAVLSSFSKDRANFTTLFWYQFPDNLKMTDRLRVKLHILQSGILQHQNNGAVILLATPTGNGSTDNMKSLVILQSFAADLAPVIDNFIP